MKNTSTILLLLYFTFHLFLVNAQKPRLVIPSGHDTKGLETLDISPDGKFLLSASIKKVILWEIATGRQIFSFKGSDPAMFLPYGNLLLIKSQEKVLTIVNYVTNEIARNFYLPGKHLGPVALSRDGRFLYCVNSDLTNDYLLKYEVSSSRLVNKKRYIVDAVTMDISPDGKWMLLGGNGTVDDYPKIQLINLSDDSDKRLYIKKEKYYRNVTQIGFSKDGTQAISIEKSGRAKLWEMPKGKFVKELYSDDPLTKMAYENKGNLAQKVNTLDNKYSFELVYNNSYFLMKNTSDGKEVRRFEGYINQGNFLLTENYDQQKPKAYGGKELNLWKVENGVQIQKITIPSDKKYTYFGNVAFSPKNDELVFGDDNGTVFFKRLSDGENLNSFYKNGNNIAKVVYAPDGNSILVGTHGSKPYMTLFSGSGSVQKEFNSPGDVQSLAISNDGKFILKGSPLGKLSVWNFQTGNVLYNLDGGSGFVTSIAISPDSRFAVSGSWEMHGEGQVKVWDLENGKEKFNLVNSYASDVAVSPDNSYIIASKYSFSDSDQKIWIWDAETGKIKKEIAFKGEDIYSLWFDDIENRFFSSSFNSMTLWDAESGKEIATFMSIGENDWVIVTPDNYFMASKNAAKKVYYVIDGIKTLGFDQFDLQYNRPDIVMERIGKSTSKLIETYKAAYVKRLSKMGFEKSKIEKFVASNFKQSFQAPEIILPENFLKYRQTTQKEFNFSIKGKDPEGLSLDRIMVYINDVPIYEAKGKELPSNTGEISQNIDLTLSNGKNIIGVSLLNDVGVASYKEEFEVEYTGAASKPNLYIVAIGVSKYQDSEMNLDYAAKDAKDLTASLQSKKSNYGAIHNLSFLNENATRENILKVKEKLMASKVDDEVIVFVAGHGLLNEKLDYYIATHDVNFENPSEKGLLYEDLEGLLDGIPARKKLMLVDACHSGEVDKEETELITSNQKIESGEVKFRGFVNKSPKAVGLTNSFELMKQLFNDLRSGTGAMVISAASGVEFSYESDKWSNGVFTYSILEGLNSGNADINKDGQIKISELRDYVTKKVVKLTNGKQHPTSRRENLEFDFSIW